MRTFVFFAIAAISNVAIASPAEDLYGEGQAAYDRADYATAIAKWQRSYQLSGESGLLFNLAQARRLSGDCPGALATYKKFLAGDAATEQRKISEDFVRELEPACRDLEPDPGPRLNSVDGLTGTKDSRPGRTQRVAGLVTGGIGVALTVTGLAIGHRANTLGGEVTAACAESCDWAVQQKKDARGRRYARYGYALDGIGIAALAGGAVMYYLGSRETSVVVAPRGEGGAEISWSGSW